MAQSLRSDIVSSTAQDVMSAMARHGVVPHPRNYAMWYAYYTGQAPELIAAIDALIEEGKPITEARCTELYNSYLQSQSVDCVCMLSQNSVHTTFLDALERAKQVPEGAESLTPGTTQDTPQDDEQLAFLVHTGALQLNQCGVLSGEYLDLAEHVLALTKVGEVDPDSDALSAKVMGVILKELSILSDHYQTPLSLILVQVHGLEALSAQRGQWVADAARRLTVQAIRDHVRINDAVCRCDDDRFAALLCNVDQVQAQALADAFADYIQSRMIYCMKTKEAIGKLDVTISVCARQHEEDKSAFFERAKEQNLPHNFGAK